MPDHSTDPAEQFAHERLRDILDGIESGITVQTIEGEFLYANEAAARLFGCDSVAALTRMTTAQAARIFEVFDEQGRPLSFEELPSRLALRFGEKFERAVLLRVRATSAECWWNVQANPQRGPDGRVTSVVTVFADISARRQAEASARAEQARRAFIARATEELSSTLDHQATLSKIARLAVPEVADWAAVDLVVDGRVERLAVAHTDPAKIALVADIERRYPGDPDAPNGTPNILRTGVAEMVPDIPPGIIESMARDAEHLALIRALGLRSYLGVPLRIQGSTVGVITFATAESGRTYGPDDLALAVTLADRASVAIENARLYREAERARAEAELASRSKDEFLAMLGHELRNPLAPILTALDLMKLRGGLDSDHERVVVERQVRHMVRLVDDLLDVSRITRGRVELARRPVELASVVAEACEVASRLIERQGHRLTVDVARGLVIEGDPVRLAQVVSNLLQNAAKYTEPGGRIDVSASRVGDRVELRVRDNGIGIAAEMLPRVFDLFVQERQALDRAQGGLGLGLAIVRSLVALHGGTVMALSEGTGQGSEFRVSLPAYEGAVDAGAPEARPNTPTANARGASALVVDDNVDAAEMLATALELLGYEVRVAHDGPSALALADERPPAVALLDIGLPVMDGYALARRMRERESLRGCALVAVTGYGQASDRERTREAGFDAHLVKPVDLDALRATLAGLTRPSG